MLFSLLFTLFFIMKRLELSMGRMIPSGGTVNDFLMDEFIRENILPEMEYGTLIDGEGFWKGEHEPVKILYVKVYLHLELHSFHEAKNLSRHRMLLILHC